MLILEGSGVLRGLDRKEQTEPAKWRNEALEGTGQRRMCMEFIVSSKIKKYTGMRAVGKEDHLMFIEDKNFILACLVDLSFFS